MAIKAHKIRLNPTPEQETYLRRAAGTRRFVYNWGLAEWKKQYAEYQVGKREQKPTANALKKQFQALRATEYPWTLEVTKCVIEGAFADLGDAWARSFTGQNKRPKFKKKHQCRESFSLSNDTCTLGDHWIVVPVLGRFLLERQEANGTLPATIRNQHQYKRGLGKINMAESLRFVVSRSEPTAGHAAECTQARALFLGQTAGCDHWAVWRLLVCQHSGGSTYRLGGQCPSGGRRRCRHQRGSRGQRWSSV